MFGAHTNCKHQISSFLGFFYIYSFNKIKATISVKHSHACELQVASLQSASLLIRKPHIHNHTLMDQTSGALWGSVCCPRRFSNMETGEVRDWTTNPLTSRPTLNSRSYNQPFNNIKTSSYTNTLLYQQLCGKSDRGTAQTARQSTVVFSMLVHQQMVRQSDYWLFRHDSPQTACQRTPIWQISGPILLLARSVWLSVNFGLYMHSAG